MRIFLPLSLMAILLSIAAASLPAPSAPNALPKLQLRSTSFPSGSSLLTKGGKAEVARLAVMITSMFEVTSITVAGYTDNRGTPTANQRLSEARAAAVRAALIADGVDGSLITVIGYGESHPIADNTTAAGRAANRRVEIEIDVN